MKIKTTAIAIGLLALAAGYGVKAEPIQCEPVVLTAPQGQLNDALSDKYRVQAEVRA